MRPWLLRPPFFGSGRVRDFSGVVRVTSTKSATDAPRRPGVVGLYLRIPMVSPQCLFSVWSSAFRWEAVRTSADRASEDVDALALGEAHDRALGVLALAGPEAGTPGLARPVQRVDRPDLDAEHLLDRDLDLGLVGVGVHEERVLVRVEEPVALLAHDRGEEHVTVVLEEGAH